MITASDLKIDAALRHGLGHSGCVVAFAGTTAALLTSELRAALERLHGDGGFSEPPIIYGGDGDPALSIGEPEAAATRVALFDDGAEDYFGLVRSAFEFADAGARVVLVSGYFTLGALVRVADKEGVERDRVASLLVSLTVITPKRPESDELFVRTAQIDENVARGIREGAVGSDLNELLAEAPWF